MNWQYRNTVLTLCTLAFFVTMAGRVIVSPIVTAITGEFGVSNTAIGIALTGMWLSYSLAQFPSGVLADRFGDRSVILVSVGGTSLFLLFLALAPAFMFFFMSVVLLGVFAGLHYSVATTLLTRTYENIGTAIGVHNGGAPVAGLLVPLAAVWLESRFGWRAAIGLVGAVGIPIVALVAWRIRPTPPRRPDQPMRDRIQIQTFVELLSRPPIAFTVAIAVACTFVWQGLASFMPTFLVAHRGYSASLAGAFFSAYFVFQGVLQVVVGALSDRFGRDAALAGCMVCGTLGVALLIVGPGLLAVGAAVVLLGTGMSFAAATIPRFMDHLGEQERGAGIGLVRTVYGIFGAFGSVTVGYLADAYGWETSFWSLTVLMTFVFVGLVINRAASLEI
jgi:MFS family permease